MIRSFMAGLIQRVGGIEAAAAVIGARLGHDVSKGSISKRQSGHLDWPLVEIIAIEDAVGDRPVRRWLHQSDPTTHENDDLMALIAEMVREQSDATSALIGVAAGTGCRVVARKELEDVMAVKERVRAWLMREGVE